MNKVGRKLKRGLAGLLAFCVMMSSFTGIAWADDDGVEINDVSVDLDRTAMNRAARNAIVSGVAHDTVFDAQKMKISTNNEDLRKQYEAMFDASKGEFYEFSPWDATAPEDTAWIEELPDDVSVRMFVYASPSDAQKASIRERYKDPLKADEEEGTPSDADEEEEETATAPSTEVTTVPGTAEETTAAPTEEGTAPVEETTAAPSTEGTTAPEEPMTAPEETTAVPETEAPTEAEPETETEAAEETEAPAEETTEAPEENSVEAMGRRYAGVQMAEIPTIIKHTDVPMVKSGAGMEEAEEPKEEKIEKETEEKTEAVKEETEKAEKETTEKETAEETTKAETEKPSKEETEPGADAGTGTLDSTEASTEAGTGDGQETVVPSQPSIESGNTSETEETTAPETTAPKNLASDSKLPSTEAAATPSAAKKTDELPLETVLPPNGYDSVNEKLYQMTGEEGIVILFINKSDSDLYFHVDLGGELASDIYVPTSKELPRGSTKTLNTGADQKKQETAETEEAANESQGAAEIPTEPESGAEGGETEPVRTEEVTVPSEEEVTEAEETEESTVAEETTEAEETEAVTEPEETVSMSMRELPMVMTALDSDPVEDTAGPEITEETVPEPESVTAAPEEEEKTTAVEKETSAEDTADLTEGAEEETTPIKTSPSGEPDDEESEYSSPEEEWEALHGSGFEDSGAYTVTSQSGDLEAVILPPVLASNNVVITGKKTQASSGRVAMAGLGLRSDQLQPVNGVNLPFNITLYDYSGPGGQTIIGSDAFAENEIIGSYLNDWAWYAGGEAYYWLTGAGNMWRPVQDSENQVVQGLYPSQLHSGDPFTSKFQGAPGVDIFPEQVPDTDWAKLAIQRFPIETIGEGVFQKDADGYYTFQSDPVGGNGSALVYKDKSLYLSKERADIEKRLNPGGGDGGGKVGFWPFEKGEANKLLGMRMDFVFSVPENGKINGRDMEFVFEGDDDLLIYLTDQDDAEGVQKLALDVGGIHGRMKGVMNFATGEITYSYAGDHGSPTDEPVLSKFDDNKKDILDGWKDANGVWQGSSRKNPKAYLYTVEDYLSRNEGKTRENFKSEYALGAMGIERKPFTNYKLDLYYLERGGGSSNCYMHFNTPAFNNRAIGLYKSVASSDESHKSDHYSFELYYKEPGAGGFTRYTDKQIQLMGEGGYEQIDGFSIGTEYYFVETGDLNGVKQIQWTGGGASRTNDEIVEGMARADAKSPIYTVGEGATAVACTNWYDSHNDLDLSKKAVLKEDQAGHYNIELKVDGNTITAQDPATKQPITAEPKNVVATDTLSEFVDFEGDKPALELYVDGTTVKLSSSKSGDKVVYQDRSSGKTVVELNTKTKSITWYVTTPVSKAAFAEGEALGKGKTAKLVCPVKVTSKAKYQQDATRYPDKPDAGTGTHAERNQELGYYSNDKAEVDYELFAGVASDPISFPRPVVRPGAGGVIKIEKALTEDSETPPEDVMFTFSVELKNGDGEGVNQISAKALGKDGAIKGSGADEPTQPLGSGDANQALTVSSSDGRYYCYVRVGGSIELSGLPEDTVYVINELGLDDKDDPNLNEAYRTYMKYYKVSLYEAKATYPESQAARKARSGQSNTAKIDGNLYSNGLKCNILYTNICKMKTGTLTIQKQLQKKDTEDATFVFKIQNLDADGPAMEAAFYAYVTVPTGDVISDVSIAGLPYGSYRVTEMKNMRYTAVGEVEKTVVIQNQDDNTVRFTNTKDTSSYFSKTDIAVNEVKPGTDGGFDFWQRKENRTVPQQSEKRVVQAWAPTIKTDADEDGTDTPLV